MCIGGIAIPPLPGATIVILKIGTSFVNMDHVKYIVEVTSANGIEEVVVYFDTHPDDTAIFSGDRAKL